MHHGPSPQQLDGSAAASRAPLGRGADLFNRVARSQSRVQWLLSAIVALVAAAALLSVSTNRRFGWGVVGQYMFSHEILLGLLKSLELTAISATIGFALAVVLAVMRLSGAALPSAASQFYVWFFRGTPLLVQLIFWYNLGALYPRLELGIPKGPTLLSGSANDLITPFSAAILGLGLNAAAYMSEIVRAGVQSIHHGQSEAAQSLGLSKYQTLRYVLMPQAMRVIVPPASNEVIGMLKYSSIVSVVAVPELLYTSQLIYARTFQTIPLLIVASTWYLLVTTLLTVVQHFIERHYARGVRGVGRISDRTEPGGANGAPVPRTDEDVRPLAQVEGGLR